MTLRSGWKRLFRLSESDEHVEAQVDDELRHHLAELLERYRSQGMSDEEARAEIARRFPDVGITRNDLVGSTGRAVQNRRRRLFLDGLRSDLRVSLRQFRRRPGFSALAVLTLGLGIGASTTLYSVVNGVLLDPLPYPDSDQLVYIATSRRQGVTSRTTAPEFIALHRQTRTLESYTAYQDITLNTNLGSYPEQFTASEVTEDYFDVFGLRPVLGRAFYETDYSAEAQPVMIVSHRVWQHYYSQDPAILGTVIAASRRNSDEAISYSVVGIMPPSFQSSADFWIPIRLAGTHWEHNEWRFGSFAFTSVGRLRPGLHLEDIQAEAARVAADLKAENPRQFTGFYEGRHLVAFSLLDRMVTGYRSSILLLFGATIVLLVIAVANLTGFLLARVLNRRPEISIRSMLGAGHARILRLLLTETSFLSFLGGVTGLTIAMAGVRVVQVLAPSNLPRLDNLTPDIRVAVFAVSIALVSGLLSSLVPFFSITRNRSVSSLQSGNRSSDPKRTLRLRGILVSVQTALAVVLLVGGGLLANSFMRLRQVDPGCEVENLLVMPLQLPGSYDTDEKYSAFFREVVERIRSLPGVESASWIPNPPLYGQNMSSPARTEEMGEEEAPHIGIHPVGPDYFETMGITVIHGRGITRTDNAANPPVAIIDELLAEEFWPSTNPIGQRLHTRETWFTVVGVTGRIHQSSLGQEIHPEIYISSLQHTVRFSLMRVVIRSAIPPENLSSSLRAAVWEVDPTLPVPTIETMKDRVSADLRDPRFYTFLFSAFSFTAVILTLAGIYALMLFLVTGRTREIGIRMALGAERGHVLWTVSRQCLGLIVVGSLIGLAAATATSRLLSGLLFGITPLDLPTYAGVAVILGLTATIACLLPTRRALRLDPMTVLRGE